jgi:hypothetical protein
MRLSRTRSWNSNKKLRKAKRHSLSRSVSVRLKQDKSKSYRKRLITSPLVRRM